MKGIKEFLELLKNDKGILAEVEKVQDDASKVVAIAKKHGYEFTEDEYNDLKMEAVSGGSKYVDLIKGMLETAAKEAWHTVQEEKILEKTGQNVLDAVLDKIGGKTK